MTTTPVVTSADYTISASAPIADIIAIIKRHGAVVLQGLVTAEDAKQMKADIQPYLDELAPKDEVKVWDGDFFPDTTRKVAGLVTKSATFAEKVVVSPILDAVANDILGRRTKLGFPVTKGHWATCKPLLNVTSALEIHPGAVRQPLHRDDHIFHHLTDEATEWIRGREVSILCFVACSKVTPENGGTLWIPGSHLWGDDHGASYDDVHAASMELGDAFLFLGRTVHAGGTNAMRTGHPDSVRLLMGAGYCLGTLRQEENMYLNNRIEDMVRLPRAVLEKIGFAPSIPMLGWYKFGHPLNYAGYSIPDSDEMLHDKDQSDSLVA